MLEIFPVYFEEWIDSFNAIIIIVTCLFIMYLYVLFDSGGQSMYKN